MSGLIQSVRIIGGGRAGSAFALALREAGIDVDGPWGRDVDPSGATRNVDLVLLCVSDAAVAEVASRIDPSPDVVIAHIAGSLGLDVLEPHVRRASLHPVVSLPDGPTGAPRLLGGATFVVSGDPGVTAIVEALNGRAVVVPDADRVLHHAACCVASNHVVALMGQVERLAEQVGVPADMYYELATGSLANAQALGAAEALTGPAARGDLVTIERHLAALDPSERPGYEAMVEMARRLADERDGGVQ